MGTINYRTSDFITLGLEPYDCDEYENEDGEIDFDARHFDMECDRENIQDILNRYSFYYFHVKIEPGYYEGFSIDIENNYCLCFDSWQDKRAAQKEITQLKKFMLECMENGLCVVWPGWCTTYKSKEESITEIKEAVKAMRAEVLHIPTWLYCERMGIEV